MNTGWESVFAVAGFLSGGGVGQIVLGCPYDDAHVENAQTEKVRKFGAGLGEVCGLPVDYEDEKYTDGRGRGAAFLEWRDEFSEKKRRVIVSRRCLFAVLPKRV